MVVGEVVARESTVGALRFVEPWMCGSIPRSCTCQSSISAEPWAVSAIRRSGYSSKRSTERSIMRFARSFGLADRRYRPDINNDRVFAINLI